MKALRIPPIYKCIGLCDADLLDNGTRHPNLVLMKIAGFLFDNHIPFELILEQKVHLDRYEHHQKFLSGHLAASIEKLVILRQKDFFKTCNIIISCLVLFAASGCKKKVKGQPPCGNCPYTCEPI